MHKLTVFVILFVVSIGLSGIAYGEINQNNVFVLEGTGFGVDKNTINNSKMDFIFSTGSSSGSTISTTANNGIFNLNTAEYVLDFKGTSYRDGQYLRFSGTAISSTVNTEKVSISLFGRLVQDSAEGAVYGFTGKLTKGTQTQKLVYNAKVSKLSDTTVATKTTEQKIPEVRILKGASGIESLTYRDIASTNLQLRYLSHDRIVISPGSKVTFVNEDVVPHKILSGEGLGTYNRLSQKSSICYELELREGSRFSSIDKYKDCGFLVDGRIDTNSILPGASKTVTFNDKGFYRLIDPDYPWINIVVYSFPDVDSLKIRGTEVKQN